MLPEGVSSDAIEELRASLDLVGVGERLAHVRDFVWRGGEIRAVAGLHGARRALDVAYVLSAAWPAAALEHDTQDEHGLVRQGGTVVEGRWVRATRGYDLRVGIDLSVASAIYVRSAIFASHVPCVGRPPREVEDRLQSEMNEYVARFVGRCVTVPEATAAGRAQLRRLGLT